MAAYVMASPRLVTWLTASIAFLATFVCLAAFLWEDGEGRSTVTSVRGEEVELFGKGLYLYDTVFVAASSRGTDLVTLVLGVPLLLLALVLVRRGSMPGALVFAGVLGYFLYVYASRALGNAYNGLFLLYIALFSASLFAFFSRSGRSSSRRSPRGLRSGGRGGRSPAFSWPPLF